MLIVWCLLLFTFLSVCSIFDSMHNDIQFTTNFNGEMCVYLYGDSSMNVDILEIIFLWKQKQQQQKNSFCVMNSPMLCK